MGKVFTLEDVKELAKHMAPIADRMGEIKKLAEIDGTLSIYSWQRGGFHIRLSTDDDEWVIKQNEDGLKADHFVETITTIDLTEADNG